ncbi:MAG TPA: serine/threonine-protein kinase, partial [Polyangia bacterium]|nr:serine/threonine-protein kinase [Polyangia bacterium]
EARAANAIRHPNIIEILDSGMREDGVPYLVMELLEGESLGQRIRRSGLLPMADAIAFVLQTASALGAAHKKGIVHRDLKPDNLFIVPVSGGDESGRVEADGPNERMKVLDFGIAKLQMPQPGDSVKTRTGTLMGTPVYMSPEQCRGTKMVDHRSDVYSLGIIFYEMLVGHPPFVSDGFGELVNMHLNVPPPSARVSRPEVTEQLDAIILKMLAKNPEDRYPDMGSLTSAIRLAAGPPFSVHRSSPDLSHAPTQAATPAPVVAAGRSGPPGDGRPAQPQVTTFRTGVGEVTVPPTIQTGGGRGKLIGGVVALAALGGGAYFFLGGAKVEAPPVAIAAPKPAPVAAAPAPVAVPAPKPAAPVAPRTVTVRLATDPQGAQIFDVAGGPSLGTTPLSLTRPRGAALKVRITKDGYVEATRDVPLDEDQALEFALDHKAAPPKPHAAHKASHDRDRGADDGPAKL